MIKRNDISNIVKQITTYYQSQDPFRIAKEMGATVLYVPLKNVNGFYQRYLDQDLIYVNENLTEEEKILVCAHELGHMVLHNNVNSIFLESIKQVDSVYELEANIFACMLLHENLNFNAEIPLIDWTYNNDTIRKQVISTLGDL
ncbi:MAG: ImmA/IrrE family metallo-endopeptidase [Lachnospiraceae bacterium]